MARIVLRLAFNAVLMVTIILFIYVGIFVWELGPVVWMGNDGIGIHLGDLVILAVLTPCILISVRRLTMDLHDL